MGSSPPVCSFTASLIQVAHVESRCATIIYMNGIENFLLRGKEKRREGVRNVGAREGGREGRKKERAREIERIRIKRAVEGERGSKSDERVGGGGVARKE